ncbi:MAG TPA: phosphate uptake regulator PhoU [Candidatus Nanoarchaeia archaeon]|nr:phosphate uptake regulator PhoU [Candidatus Nanoarchaeia archaeon]
MVKIKRKIVQHGPSTLIISLPSQWVKQHGVRKGDELDVKEQDKTLIISVDKVIADYSLTQDISGFNSFLLTRFLGRSYQKGYDKLYLIHNNPELLKAVQEKILELIGYEIIEQNDKNCVIQSISSHIELDFENSLRKAFLIVKQIIENCYDAYKNEDTSTLQNLYLKDIQVNRFCYFCQRQINKEQYVPFEQSQQSHVLYYLIEVLEDLGDTYKKLAQELAASKKKNKEVLGLLKLIFEQFDVSYSFFYKATLEKANRAFELYIDIGKKINEIVGTGLIPSEIFSVYKIKEASKMVYHITTMRLDMLKDTKLSSEPNSLTLDIYTKA